MRPLLIAILTLSACGPGTVLPSATITGSAVFGFAQNANDLGPLFDHTPAYPGYRWTRNGHDVAPEEMGTIAGPAHCEWDHATMLFIGWPPGTSPTGGEFARQYIRDPQHVITATSLMSTLELHAFLPPDARPTGYRYAYVEVYVSPSDDAAIYVVGPHAVERWPRSDPMTLCE